MEVRRHVQFITVDVGIGGAVDAFTDISSGWIWVVVAVAGILWILHDHFIGWPNRWSAVPPNEAAVEIEKIRAQARKEFWAAFDWGGLLLALCVVGTFACFIILATMSGG